MDAPQGGKIREVRGALVNNQNNSILVLAARSVDGPVGLYRFADGKLATVAVPGQTMSDGGLLGDIPLDYYGVSRANERGQHAFLTRLQDGTTAAYLLAHADELGMRAEERMVRPAELHTAEGVWLASSVRGLAEVRSLDGVALGPLPETTRMQKLLGYA